MTVREQFRDHLRKHAMEQGFQAPQLLMEYLVDLLADRLTDCEIIPHPSFAERYLELYNCHRLSEFKDYADSSLFFVSLMPEYGRRRGLDLDYYASLGISVYYTLGDLSKDSRYIQLGNWFFVLQRFLNSAIRPERDLELMTLTTGGLNTI
jgi:hypothetical protein